MRRIIPAVDARGDPCAPEDAGRRIGSGRRAQGGAQTTCFSLFKFDLNDVEIVFVAFESSGDPMQVGRATDIEERLMNAWIFLSGERREFVETVPPVNAAPAHGEAIALLPVEGAEGGVAGCRMVITLELARRVAAHLFGLPAGDLTRADIDDAIRETCNVLGSCIAQGIAPAGSLRIGCPTTGAAGPEEASTLCQFHGLGHFPPHGDRTPRLDLITHAPRPRSTESPE